jgi:hypothetical protein
MLQWWCLHSLFCTPDGHEFKISRVSIGDNLQSARLWLDVIDAAILKWLINAPFSWLPMSSEDLHIGGIPVSEQTTTSLGRQCRHSTWVLYMLTEKAQRKRVADAKVFLKVLEAESHIDFFQIITGNKSWIFLNAEPRSISIRQKTVPIRPSSEIGIVTVCWDIKGNVFINYVTPTSHRACHLTELASVENFSSRLGPYLHSAKSHNSMSNLQQVTHFGFNWVICPLSSQNIVLPGFFLFDWLKGELVW